MTPTAAYIQLQFRPNVHLISSARQFVADFYDHVVGDPAALSRILLATHELLENAVKYAVDGVTLIRIDVTDDGGPMRRVMIKTSNKADPLHRDVLLKTVEEARQAVDPFIHYQQVMLKNARRKDGSGLGLARIRAEADMSMACDIEGDEVSITVEADLPPRHPRGASAVL
jgi:two-component sensor histidine kinase